MLPSTIERIGKRAFTGRRIFVLVANKEKMGSGLSAGTAAGSRSKSSLRDKHFLDNVRCFCRVKISRTPGWLPWLQGSHPGVLCVLGRM